MLNREKRSDWVKAPWPSSYQVYPCKLICAYAPTFLLTTKEKWSQILSSVNLSTYTWFLFHLCLLKDFALILFFFSPTSSVRDYNLDHPHLYYFLL